MAIIKAFTDIEQSKKLAEILPIESADMFLAINGTIPVMAKYIDDGLVTADDTAIPCWSLAALLTILHFPSLHKTVMGWRCDTYRNDNKHIMYGESKDNPVDACVAMIEKLHKLKML